MRRLLFLGVVLMALSVCSSAGVIDFSGSGSSGTLTGGESWVLTANSQTLFGFLRGVTVWGAPGIGLGDTTYSGAGNMIEFSITFTNLPNGVSIDQTPDPGGFNDHTRFISNDNGTDWTPTFTGTNIVTFDMPAGDPVASGEVYFVNVAFTGGNFSSVSFTGDEGNATVPEPSTLGFVGAGLAAAGMLRRRFSAR